MAEKTFLVNMTRTELVTYSNLILNAYKNEVTARVRESSRTAGLSELETLEDTAKLKAHMTTLPKIELVGEDSCEFISCDDGVKFLIIEAGDGGDGDDGDDGSESE
jgi:hypothetical protein